MPGRGSGLEAEGVNNEDEGGGGGEEAALGCSGGTSKLEMSSPSWAKSAIVVPTGMPLAPFCAYVKCSSITITTLSRCISHNILLFSP